MGLGDECSEQIREGDWQVALEQRPKGGGKCAPKGTSSKQGNSMCKGPEAGTCLARPGKSKGPPATLPTLPVVREGARKKEWRGVRPCGPL